MVVISIDQFSASLFEQYRADFHGGLGRLARQGTVYPSGFQSHGMTETCPGHSTLLTGKYPNKTGIVANDFYDLTTGKKTYCLADPSVTLANDPSGGGLPGQPQAADGADLRRLAEGRVARQPGLRGVGQGSRGDQHGRPQGRRRVLAGDAVRHDHLGRARPGRQGQAGARGGVQRQAGGRPEEEAVHLDLRRQRCAALEGDYVTGGRAWRAALPRPTPKDEAAATDDLSVSPYSDRVTLEAAQFLRDEFKLGDGEATDVLTVSLSATDFIGHRFGTKGPEMCDHLLRLDDRLGAFLDSLDKVKGQVLVVLAADHGGSDFPERLAQQGYDAGRVPPTQWLKDLNAALRDQLGVDYDPLVQAGGIESLYVVGPDGKTPTAGDHARVTAAPWPSWPSGPRSTPPTISNTLFTMAPPPKGTPPDEISVAERMRRSAYPGRVGDILVAFQPYQTPASPGASYVASHGSPWNYDRRVPILFWWKGGPARERVLPIETVDIAPTIAAVTGVPVPADVDGRCLPLGAGPGC